MPWFLRPRRSQTAAPASGPGTAGDLQLSAESPYQQGQSATPTGPPAQSAAPPRADTVAAGPQSPPLETAQQDMPGFGQRGRMRRRLHFLRKARELAYRDLGGLVFDLHRFGQRHDELVVAKLATLTHIDAELRALEVALEEQRSITVLREAGIAACPRCAAIHGSDDRFCPSCGMPVGVQVGGPLTAPASAPMAGAPVSQASPPVQSQAPNAAQQPPIQSAPAPSQPATPAQWGNTSEPAEGQRPPSDLLRPAAPVQGTEEDQPTQILGGEQRPQAGEQPTQGFDSPFSG
ncbi:MAG: hypothetical protein ACRDK2_16455 [Solirubrobacteraceae bacterium]